MASETKTRRAELEWEIERVRGEVLQLLVEADWVKFSEIPRIEMLLVRKVGMWHIELERCKLEAKRAMRRGELARALLGKSGNVDCRAVEQAVGSEFSHHAQELLERERACAAIIGNQRTRVALGECDERELKELHRILVGRLHPFLGCNPNASWNSSLSKARLALKRADLPMMRSVEQSTRPLHVAVSRSRVQLSDDELNAELAILNAKAAVAQERLSSIESEVAYTMRAFIEDQKWVEAKVAELSESIARQKELAALYQSYYLELVFGVA